MSVRTCVAVAVLVAAVQTPPVQAMNFEFKDRPSFRFGQVLRVDLRARILADFRAFSPDLVTPQGTFDLSSARLALEGKFLKHLEYQVERDFQGNLDASNKKKHAWSDVYANFDYYKYFELQAGKFKIPFSMEELTGVYNLDFINRARVADNLAPARDIGVVLHGVLFTKGFGYQVGVFRNDGENSESKTNVRGGRTYALRLTGAPLNYFRLPAQLGKIGVGAAAVSTDVPEGLNSLRGHTNSGDVFFSHVYVQGPRRWVGTEFLWQPGPFSIKHEWIHVSEAREQQSTRATNLPAKISDGWYITAAWTVTGETSVGGIVPAHPFPSHGIGAIQIAGRYEQVRFDSTDHTGIPFSSPRAPNILGNSDRVWTAGINWYANHFIKIQVNGIHETIEDVDRSPIPGRSNFWMGILRLQFAM